MYRTNIFGYFFMTKAALPHLPAGGAVINTTSVEANTPQAKLMDYASTKGAILTFTRGLAKELIEKGIRVNAVAPGPIWTPLIPASFPAEHIRNYGNDTPMKRAGQPARWPRATYSWPRPTPRTWSGSACTPMAAWT